MIHLTCGLRKNDPPQLPLYCSLFTFFFPIHLWKHVLHSALFYWEKLPNFNILSWIIISYCVILQYHKARQGMELDLILEFSSTQVGRTTLQVLKGGKPQLSAKAPLCNILDIIPTSSLFLYWFILCDAMCICSSIGEGLGQLRVFPEGDPEQEIAHSQIG